MNSFLDDLSSILAPADLLTSTDDMAPHISEPRRRYHQSAIGVALPRDVAQVQAVVRTANRHNVPLIPQGGNTGLVGAQVPKSGTELIVSLKRLDQVIDVDAAAGHMSVETGVTLRQAQDAAHDAGALFPLTIASQGTATIGGVLSSNAGGVQVLAYGNARELCLGVDVVLPNGDHLHGLNSLLKNNTGYDLKDLFVGAEGTLGFITAATLKLFPQPEANETAWVSVDSPRKAIDLFSLAKDRLGQTLTAFELMPHFGVDLLLRHQMIAADPSAASSPWYVLIEVSRPKGGQQDALLALLEVAAERDLLTDASIAQSLTQREQMWLAREQMSEVQSREGASIKHDVAVPLAKVPDLIERGVTAVEKLVPGVRPCPFGHMGDGNLHFNFTQPEGWTKPDFMARDQDIHNAIYEIVLDLGGTVSAEHGIGQLKLDLLRQVKDPVALMVMQQIKRAIDPNNIMNPGKMLRLDE